MRLEKIIVSIFIFVTFSFLGFAQDKPAATSDTGKSKTTPTSQPTGQTQANSPSATVNAAATSAVAAQPSYFQGKADVSYAGSFTYSFPIDIPPGTNGVAPSLSLNYNSSCPNGMMGMGFSINGLPTIERDPSYPTTFTENDHYIYQGQKLIYSNPNSPSPGDGFFHTEREGYELIKAFSADTEISPTANPNTTTSHWVVYKKDGSKLFFGNTSDSRIDAIGKNQLPRLWALSRFEDVNGNYYTVNYNEDLTYGDYYPTKIIYTQGNGLQTYKAVLFSYDGIRKDEERLFNPTLVDMDRRLRWITVKTGVDSNGNGGCLVRKYRVTYTDVGPSFERSRINMIQVYGTDGNSPSDYPTAPWIDENYLPTGTAQPPITFIWQTNNGNGVLRTKYDGWFPLCYGWMASTGNTTWAGAPGDVVITGDFNGDGKSDVFMYNSYSGSRACYLSAGDGTFSAGWPQMSSGWMASTGGTTWVGSPGDVATPGDYNGDGKTDIFMYNSYSGSRACYLSVGDGTFSAGWPQMSSGWMASAGGTTWVGAIGDVLTPGDYNGDGKTDIFMYNPKFGSRACYLSVGDGTFSAGWPQMSSGWMASTGGTYWVGTLGDVVIAGDFNGDGKTDVFMYNTNSGSRACYLSVGDGTFSAGWPQMSSGWMAGPGNIAWTRFSSGDVVTPGDYNGDGKTDIFMYNTVSGKRGCYLSVGNGTFSASGSQTSDGWLFSGNTSSSWFCHTNTNGSDTIHGLDCDGNGISDILMYNANDGIRATYLAADPPPCLLSTIQTSFGGTITATYAPAPQVPGAIVPSGYPTIANTSPRPLIIQTVFNGGQGEVVTTKYGYYNGKRYSGTAANRVDLGFETVTITNEAAGTRTVTTYWQDKPYQGLVKNEYISDLNGVRYAGKTNTYNTVVNPSNSNIQFLLLDSTTTQIYDGQPTSLDSTTNYEYGDFGDITRVTTHGYTAYSNGYDETRVALAYASCKSPYVVKLQSKTFSSCDPIGILGVASQTLYYYDENASLGQISKGLLSKTVASIDSANSISTVLRYEDYYGNVTKSSDANGNWTSFVYDETYHDLVHKTTNAVDQTVTVDYDAYRRPFQVTDVNDQKTITGYDVFGRVTSITVPTDSTATSIIEYGDTIVPLPFPCYAHTRQRISNTDYLERYDYYDGLGRPIQTKTEGTNAQWITVDRQYDGAGRNNKTSIPYFTNSLAWSMRTSTQVVETLFDAIGRVTETRNPDQTSKKVTYSKNVTTFTDENGHIEDKYINIFNSQISYQRRYEGKSDAALNLYSTVTVENFRGLQQIIDDVKPISNLISISLDMLGRKTNYNDPDKGNWSYKYDNNGNILSQTDGNNTEVKFKYDKLNRITEKSYPHDPVVEYKYDESGHGYANGKLTTVKYYRGVDSYIYDNKGRLSSFTRTLDGISRTLVYTYDSRDQITSVQYPDGELVINGYGFDGNLASVSSRIVYFISSDEKCFSMNYVTSIAYTAFGAVSDITYGNNIKMTYDYYDTDTEVDPSSGKTYSYRIRTIQAGTNNSVLNLSYEYDSVGNVLKKTDNSPTFGNIFERYVYDDFDRLTSASAPGSYGTLSFDYNQIDNITKKDGRTYIYDSRPHAVTSTGSSTYGYDNNGNMNNRNGKAITYDDAARMVSLTIKASIEKYYYDAGTQRTIKEQGTKRTYYFFPLYEEEYTNNTLTKTIKYYEANGHKVAQMSSVASEGFLYIYADHLGSTVRMTNASGTTIIRYKPYGTTISSSGTATTRYQFTGQEKEGSGLYYYNARYYDPDLGRFIQPDSKLDGLNRYAYCHNNPVRYTDPRGERAIDEPEDGVIIYEPVTNAGTTGVSTAPAGRGSPNTPTVQTAPGVPTASPTAAPEAPTVFTATNPIQQLWFDNRYGFSGPDGSTVSCGTCAGLNVYAAETEGGYPLKALDETVNLAKGSGVLAADGSPTDMDSLSRIAAHSLQRVTFYHCGGRVDENSFKTSNAPAGIAVMFNQTTSKQHIISEIRTQSGIIRIDSLDSNRPQAQGYQIQRVVILIEDKLVWW